MSERKDEQAVAQHYGRGDLIAALSNALTAAGKNLDALTIDDLATIDQFHTRGKASTMELAQRAGLKPGMHMLDVGGGLGGPARMIASEFGVNVTVLDLTEEFVRAGTWLTERVRLTDRVRFKHGSALDMPFLDASYDLVWTQHASMNISDKKRLYAEIYRVLRPGGRFALHDIMAGTEQPVHFPVPWASDPATSHLGEPEAIRALLKATGFQEVEWVDETSTAVTWFQLRGAPAPGDRPALSLRAVIGDNFAEAFANQVRNLNENRITIFQGVFERPIT